HRAYAAAEEDLTRAGRQGVHGEPGRRLVPLEELEGAAPPGRAAGLRRYRDRCQHHESENGAARDHCPSGMTISPEPLRTLSTRMRRISGSEVNPTPTSRRVGSVSTKALSLEI